MSEHVNAPNVAAEPPLTWVRPKWHRQVFELRAGAERLALLRWVRSWGSVAEVETSFGTWRCLDDPQ